MQPEEEITESNPITEPSRTFEAPAINYSPMENINKPEDLSPLPVEVEEAELFKDPPHTDNVIIAKLEETPASENKEIVKEETKQNDEIVNSEEVDKTIKKPFRIADYGFKKGQPSANPNGRPKGTFSFIPLIKKALKEQCVDDKGNAIGTKASIMVNELLQKAIKGKDLKAMKELIDRIDGTPAQTIKGDKEAPLASITINHYAGDEGNKSDKIPGPSDIQSK